MLEKNLIFALHALITKHLVNVMEHFLATFIELSGAYLARLIGRTKKP